MAYPYPLGYSQPPPMSFPPPQQHPPYYGAPLPPVYAQPAYPPPMPMQQQQPDLNDRNQFRAYYSSGLRALMGNDKRIITELTILANEFSGRSADIVVQLLEEHIRMVDPSIKLPALYLMDSICKNIGAPYTTLLSNRVERLFLSAFRDVDPPTKIKMEEMLGTWRTGGPNNGPLFQGRAQHEIETALFGPQLRGGGIGGQGKGVNENRHFLAGAQQLPSMASKAERQSVTSDVRRLLAIWEMRANLHPEDPSPREQIEALKQLEHILNTATLTSDAVAGIRKEITALTPTDSVPLITPRPEAQPQPAAATDFAALDFSKLASLMPSRQASQQPPAPANDAFALLSGLNLDTMAQLKNLSALTSGSGTPAPVVDNSEDDYEQLVLRMDMKLQKDDIARYRPSAPELLYDRLPLQCKQCAARFLESPSGHAKLQVHHDRHFRHKKRLREAQRVQSRSYFASEEDWISPPKLNNAATAALAEQAAPVVQRPLGRVIAPKDPAKAARPCPICKEPFKGEFNEGEEEFIWLDAVELDGVIYHDSCHSEAMRSRLLSAPTRSAVTSSREGTPMSADGRAATPSGSAGRKRKAEDDASADEAEGKRVKAEEED